MMPLAHCAAALPRVSSGAAAPGAGAPRGRGASSCARRALRRPLRCAPRAAAAPPPAQGYSAGDSPELRKNPSLYAAASPAAPPAPAPRPARKPHVLAPAGGWPQLRAAVACGADAVYFGLDAFNARARAENFTLAELPALMADLRAANVRGYVALNILLFDDELPEVEARIRAMAAAGVDAVIVQDVGAVALIRRVAPGLPVHASTQMTVTSAEGARFAAALGAARVVAGRELSVRELKAVVEGAAPLEVEAFVHGALCVSYSGQCLSSEAWGGRSANRGQCAQACRLPYGLLVDGVLQQLADVAYLLSPQDLCGLGHVAALMDAGVACFKIEGRLKGPEYVAATVTAYRAAVDAAWAARSTATSAPPPPPDAATLRDLAQVFARGQDEKYSGLSAGFLDGVAHQALVRGRAPRHRGVYLGVVTRVTRRGVEVRLSGGCAARRGVGVVFDAGAPEEREEGGSVYELYDGATGRRLEAGEEATEGVVELAFGKGALDVRRVRAGHRVWRNKDPALEARLRAAAVTPPRARGAAAGVHATVCGAAGSPLTLTLTALDATGGTVASATAASASPLTPAASRALSAADVAREVGTLAAAGLALAAPLDTSALHLAAPPLFLPAGEVKRARAAAAADLAAQLSAAAAAAAGSRAAGLAPPAALAPMLAEARAALATSSAPPMPRQQKPQIRLLCRTAAQVRAALAVPWLTEIVLDFLEVHGLATEVRAVQASGRRAVVATPRVLKPDEERLVTFYLRLQADALLVRSIGMLQQLASLDAAQEAADAVAAAADGALAPSVHPAGRVPPLHGDFSLNAANTLSAAALLASARLARLTPAHDLSAQQLAALARSVGSDAAARLELVVHQRLPIFHTEHCLFARHLSSGSSYKDCGHPCERHALHLAAPDGSRHAVLADMGCRNTVFNGGAQSGAALGAAEWRALVAAGVGGLRVELLEEAPDDVAPLLEAYAALAASAAPEAPHGAHAAAAAAVAAAAGPAGITRGSLQGRVEQRREDMKPTAAAGRR